jgi:hypothetical protein
MRRQQPRRFQALRSCYGLCGYSAGPRMARPVGERFLFPERSPFHARQLCVQRRRPGRHATRSRRDKRHVVRPVASFRCGAARQPPYGRSGGRPLRGHAAIDSAKAWRGTAWRGAGWHGTAWRGTSWRGTAWERPGKPGPLRPRHGVAAFASVARPRHRTARAARPSALPRTARYVAVNAPRPLL